MKILRCEGCGAPVRHGASECAYCRAPLHRDAEEPERAAPRAGRAPEAARLRRALAEGGGSEIFEAGARAWARLAQVGEERLSGTEPRDAARLSSMLGVAYAASLVVPQIGPSAYDERVRALWALVDGRLDRRVLEHALEEWDEALAEDGPEDFARRASGVLGAPTARRAALELAVAAACPAGRFTHDDEDTLEALAEVFGAPDELEEIAARVSRPLE